MALSPALKPYVGQPVRCHQNLNTGTLVVRARVNGKWTVIAHPLAVVLRDVSWHVGEKTRQRIAAGGHRSVHAYALGTLVDEAPNASAPAIRYRPHERGCFYRVSDGAPITASPRVSFAVEDCAPCGKLRLRRGVAREG